MPDYDTLERIAKELDKPVAYFFCNSKSLAELVCLIERLGEPERKELIERLKDETAICPIAEAEE